MVRQGSERTDSPVTSWKLKGLGGGGGESTQLYEKAVGYAKGYAAGLDQAKEVLSGGGLDLGVSLFFPSSPLFPPSSLFPSPFSHLGV